MSIGPATLIAILAAGLATLVWWIAARLNAPAWACLFLFGVVLVLVQIAGPLVQLP